MRRIINFRSSKTRMMILALVDIATMIMNSYLALILRHEGHYSWIDDKYINSIQSYMIINIVTTLIIFILLLPIFLLAIPFYTKKEYFSSSFSFFWLIGPVPKLTKNGQLVPVPKLTKLTKLAI